MAFDTVPGLVFSSSGQLSCMCALQSNHAATCAQVMLHVFYNLADAQHHQTVRTGYWVGRNIFQDSQPIAPTAG